MKATEGKNHIVSPRYRILSRCHCQRLFVHMAVCLAWAFMPGPVLSAAPQEPGNPAVLKQIQELVDQSQNDEKQGRYESALEKINAAYRMCSSMPGTEYFQAGILSQQGWVLFELGRYSESVASGEIAAGIYAELGRKGEQAGCLANVAQALVRQGRTAEAIALHQSALELFPTDSGFRFDQMKCTLGLATGLTHAGNLAEAIEMLENVVASADEASVDKYDNVLSSLGLSAPAADVSSEVRAEYRSFKAGALVNLGTVLSEIGNDERAIERFHQAHEIFKSLPGHERDQAICLVDEGHSLNRLERYSEAEEKVTSALSMFQPLAGTDYMQGMAMFNLGACYCESGRKQQAQKHFEAAMQLLKSLPEANVERYDCQGNYAHALMGTGKYAEAKEMLLEVISLYRETSGTEQRVLHNQYNLGICLIAQNQNAAALPYLLQSVAGRWDFLIRSFPRLPEPAKRQFVEKAFISPDGVYTLALMSNDSGSTRGTASLDAALMSKGIVEEAVRLEQQVLREKAPAGWKADYDRLDALKGQRSTLLDPRAGTVGVRREKLVDVEESISQLETELARRNAAFENEMLPKRLVTQDVVDGLAAQGGNAALIEIVKYDRNDYLTTDPLQFGKDREARFGALVLAPRQNVPVPVDLGPAEPAIKLLSEYRKALESVARTFPDMERRSSAEYEQALVSSEGALAASASELRKIVFDPLRAHLGGANRIFLAPDAELHLLPFELLTEDSTGNSIRYLAEQYEFIYLNSGRDLPRMQEIAAIEPGRGAVIVAAPNYDLGESAQAQHLRSLCSSSNAQTNGMPQITQTDLAISARTEESATLGMPKGFGNAAEYTPISMAKEYAQTTSKLLTGAFGEDPVVLLEGDQALEGVVKRVVSPRVLEFATHGVYLPQDKDASSSAGNPLLHSWLALAGANRSSPQAGRTASVQTTQSQPAKPARSSAADSDAALDNGLLTAYEISGMDLRGTELVALTACESGLGGVEAGESVAGLRRAFMLAGARSMIVSLWSVPSRESFAQMQQFYQAWLGKKNPGKRYEAFHTSQLGALKSARQTTGSGHPWLWAGFIYTGEPASRQAATSRSDQDSVIGVIQ